MWTAVRLRIEKQLQETVHSTLLLECFYLLYMLYSNLSPGVLLLALSCFVCNFC